MPNSDRSHSPDRRHDIEAEPSRRRALLVAYYFPPVGGGGTQRPLKLARYLPRFRWHVEVLTGAAGGARDLWSPEDASLLGELDPSVVIHRAQGPEASNDRRHERLEQWFRIDAPWAVWWRRNAERAALEASADVDVIVATMPPYQTAAAVASASQKSGKPWVADLRDPWAFDEMRLFATGLHQRLEQRQMRQLLGTSAAIVTTTPELARRIAAAFPELADRPIVSIANGYDAADFAGPPPVRSDRAFRIVHTGTFHADLGQHQRASGLRRRLVGGDVRGSQILTRSQIFLLEAIDRLQREGRAKSPVELHLAGAITESDRQIANRSSVVRLYGHISHGEAIDLIRSADLLFLPMQKMPPGVRAKLVPGKMYEYLAAQRPILAAVPQGDARDILKEAGTAHICEPDDVDAMVGAIEAEMARRQLGQQSPRASEQFLERFERQRIAKRYAELLDDVAGVSSYHRRRD